MTTDPYRECREIRLRVENIKLLKLYTADNLSHGIDFGTSTHQNIAALFYVGYYLYVVKQRANLSQTKDISDLVQRGVELHNIQLFGTKTLRVCV